MKVLTKGMMHDVLEEPKVGSVIVMKSGDTIISFRHGKNDPKRISEYHWWRADPTEEFKNGWSESWTGVLRSGEILAVFYP